MSEHSRRLFIAGDSHQSHNTGLLYRNICFRRCVAFVEFIDQIAMNIVFNQLNTKYKLKYMAIWSMTPLFPCFVGVM